MALESITNVLNPSMGENSDIYILTDDICSVCQAEFLDEDDLQHHFLQVHADKFSKDRYCIFCKNCLPTVEDLAKHLLFQHIQKLRTCAFCCRVFNSERKLKTHAIKHRTSQCTSDISCSQCSFLFTNINDLINHEEESHDNNEGLLLKSCLPYLSSILNIKAQVFLQSLHKKDSVYTCLQCSYTTSDNGAYVKHIINEKCQSVVCECCGNPYKSRKYLLSHLIRQQKLLKYGSDKTIIKSKVKCKICKQSFPWNIISNHKKSCKKSFKCSSCDLTFGSVAEMTKHHTECHPSIVSLVNCKYCSHISVGEDMYKKHFEKAHQHESHLYKYTCKACDVIYKHPKKLFAHFFTMHKDVMPYTCKICNLKFRLRKSFTLHIKIIHKSIGKVEFDEKFHVYFGDNTSSKIEAMSDHDYTMRVVQNASDGTLNANVGNITNYKPVSVIRYSGIIKENHTITNDKKEINEHKAETEKAKSMVQNMKNEQNKKSTEIDFHNSDNHQSTLTASKGKLKRKHQKKNMKYKNLEVLKSSDDDEPLSKLKKTKSKKYILNSKPRNNIFVCKVCKKKCYTFQNYNYHIRLHMKRHLKPCIKCGKQFKNVQSLEEHINNMHTKSILTETLKKVIERRKNESEANESRIEINKSKFVLKAKKVHLEPSLTKAKLKDISNDKGITVKNFLETFSTNLGKKDNPEHIAMVSVNILDDPVIDKSIIKMTKVNMDQSETEFPQLALPVRFRECTPDYSQATISMVTEPAKETCKLNFGFHFRDVYGADNNDYGNENMLKIEDIPFNDNDSCEEQFGAKEESTSAPKQLLDNSSVPEVGQEISLGDSFVQSKPKPIQRKIALSELVPPGCTDLGGVRIAHLLPNAPFYKIVTVNDLLEKPEDKPKEDLRLPEGIKLVNVNPLEHLLKGKVIKPEEPRRKCYNKIKTKNFEKVMTKAILNLKKFESKKWTKKKKKKVENNDAVEQ